MFGAPLCAYVRVFGKRGKTAGIFFTTGLRRRRKKRRTGASGFKEGVAPMVPGFSPSVFYKYAAPTALENRRSQASRRLAWRGRSWKRTRERRSSKTQARKLQRNFRHQNSTALPLRLSTAFHAILRFAGERAGKKRRIGVSAYRRRKGGTVFSLSPRDIGAGREGIIFICATSPQPNGFPSPPRVSFPERNQRFALRGPPKAEREKNWRRGDACRRNVFTSRQFAKFASPFALFTLVQFFPIRGWSFRLCGVRRLRECFCNLQGRVPR